MLLLVVLLFCVECAKCSFPIACVVHSLGCFCVFYEGGGGGGGPKKVFESFPGEGKKKKRRESKRVRDFCRRFCCLSFFFGPLDLFERYKSYGHILYYSFVWTNTLLLLLNKKRQKRPTKNPTIFSASLITSPASPRGSSSVGR